MSAKPSYFQIGLFILFAVAILAGGLIAFGAGQIFKPRIYIETYADGSVQGIDVGSIVKFRGVQIGKVSKIGFSFNEYGGSDKVDKYNYVIILMEIDKEMFPGMFSENLTNLIAENVKQGMRARIEPLGITGMNYIEIGYVKDPAEFPPLEVGWTPRYYYIPSAPGQIANILESVNSMMAEMKKFDLSKLQSDLQTLITNLNIAVSEADLPKISKDIQALVTHLDATIAEANIGKLSDEARALMAGLQKSNEDLQKVLKNIEKASRFNPDEIRQIISNLADTTANLESFSSSVKQRPSSLLWGSPPKPKISPTPKPKRR